MSLRLSLTAPQFTDSWNDLAAAARTMEELGFDGIFLLDHLMPIGDPARPVFELAASLGAVASVTSRIRVGSLVMRVPLRGSAISVAVARAAAAAAPGRFVLGLGAGDRLSAAEGTRFGVESLPLPDRVSLVDEAIHAVRETAPDVPVWVGGTHPKILEIVRSRGTGWNAWGVGAGGFAEIAGGLGEASPVTWGGAVVIGRTDGEANALLEGRRAIAGGPDKLVSELSRYVAAGAEELVLSVLPNEPGRWELFAAEVASRLR